MKREIKFRAWDKTRKKMGTVTNIEWGHEDWLRGIMIDLIDDDFDDDSLEGFNIALIPEQFELMQFTGLKDKNGKEIYEGDIVKKQVYSVNGEYVPYPKVAYKNYVIEWWIGYRYGYRMKNKRNIMHLTPSYGRDSEVIGNIYENPELL